MNNSLIIGQILDKRFRVIEALGSGGMATVFKAEQFDLVRLVALKLMHSSLIQDRDSYLRFEREAAALSSLSHKNIAMFYAYGVLEPSSFPSIDTHGQAMPYIAMEYLEGKSLRELLNEEQSLPWTRALFITKQICQALAHAHNNQLIHRDIKPNNILLLDKPSQDFVKLVDFGLAKLILHPGQNAQKLTQTGSLIGSVAYMSPEQCECKVVDRRTDVYSLGCVLYEMLSGWMPLTAENPIGLMHKHVNEVPVSLHDKLPRGSVPVGLEECVFKAMAKDPDKRYQTTSEFEEDLDLVAAGRGDRTKAYSEGHAGMQKHEDVGGRKITSFKKPAITIVLVVAILSTIYLFTDNGMGTISKWMLGSLPGEEQAIKVVDWACSLEKAGRVHTADLLKKNVVDGLEASRGNSLALPKIYLELARHAYAQGNKNAAVEWAQRSIVCMASSCNVLNLENKANRDEAAAIVKGSASIMRSCGGKLSRSAMSLIQADQENFLNKLWKSQARELCLLLCDTVQSMRSYDLEQSRICFMNLAIANAQNDEFQDSLNAYEMARTLLLKAPGDHQVDLITLQCQEASVLAAMAKAPREKIFALLNQALKAIDDFPAKDKKKFSLAYNYILTTYRYLAMPKEAVKYAQLNYDLLVQQYGEPSRLTETALYVLALTELAVNHEKGLALAKKDFELASKIQNLDFVHAFEVRTQYLQALFNSGHFEAGLRFYNQQMALFKDKSIKQPYLFVEFCRLPIPSLIANGYFKEAEAMMETYRKLLRQYKIDDIDLKFLAMFDLANLLNGKGEYEKAEHCLVKTLETAEFGAKSEKEQLLANLLWMYAFQGKLEQSDQVAAKLLALDNKIGPVRQTYYRYLFCRALWQKQLVKAEQCLVKTKLRAQGDSREMEENPSYRLDHVNLAYAKGQFADAEKYMRDYQTYLLRVYGPYAATYVTGIGLVQILNRQGKYDQAEALIKSQYDIVQKFYPGSAIAFLHVAEAMESVYLNRGKYEEAEKLARSMIDKYGNQSLVVRENELLTANRIMLAGSLLKQKKDTEAEHQVDKILANFATYGILRISFSQDVLLELALTEKRAGKWERARNLVRILLSGYDKQLSYMDYSIIDRAKSLLAECNDQLNKKQ